MPMLLIANFITVLTDVEGLHDSWFTGQRRENVTAEASNPFSVATEKLFEGTIKKRKELAIAKGKYKRRWFWHKQ